MSTAKAVNANPQQFLDPGMPPLPSGDRQVYAGDLKIGVGGASITAHLSASKSWTPGAVAAGSFASTTLTVPGALVGNTVAVGVYPAVPDGVFAAGQVVSPDTVRVVAGNLTASPVTLAAGSVRADVWQH